MIDGNGRGTPDTPLVLDTDVLNDWRFRKQFANQAIHNYHLIHERLPALTSTNIFEVLHGFEKSAVKHGGLDDRTNRNRASMEQLLNSLEVLPFNQTAAIIAAYIFPRLSKRERDDHWCDMLIAATALAHGHGVATRNRGDFELIATHLPPSHPRLYLAVWKP